MDTVDRIIEQFKVHSKDLASKVRELIHEGNVRRIIIKNEEGHTFMEIPLTVATIGVVLAPVLAAVGAIATVVSKCEVVVERAKPAAGAEPKAAADAKTSSSGATEQNVDMAGTISQHSDDKGTKIEDIAGTGEHDSLGG
jgi:hypothetical protein